MLPKVRCTVCSAGESERRQNWKLSFLKSLVTKQFLQLLNSLLQLLDRLMGRMAELDT